MSYGERVARGPLTVSGLALAVTLSLAGQAFGAGYDTPILYSARHMAMGGTAIAYVDDPSAIFHNPAGLARLRGTAELHLDVSLLIGHLEASPDAAAPRGMKSELTVAPLFLVGANFRITDWLKAGIALYPGASAAGEYRYDRVLAEGQPNEERIPQVDDTRLVFFELAPAIAVSLPGHVTLGVAYRISLVTLDRTKGAADDPKAFNLGFSGLNFKGVRVGIQWQPIPELSIGFAYRNKTVTEVEDDDGGFVLNSPVDTVKTEFILTHKLGLGARTDIADFGFAADIEYTLGGQVDRQVFELEGGLLPTINNVSLWEDNITLRLGGEYRLHPVKSDRDKILALRAGYVRDGKVGNRKYPTAFGTPPTATNSITLGGGFTTPRWRANLAYAYRFGSTTIGADEIAGRETCLPCGQDGKYGISLHGVYVDFSYRFGNVSPKPRWL